MVKRLFINELRRVDYLGEKYYIWISRCAKSKMQIILKIVKNSVENINSWIFIGIGKDFLSISQREKLKGIRLL